MKKKYAGILLIAFLATGAYAVDVAEDIVRPAQQWQGSGYCLGSARPDCFDCSGFVNYIYKPHVPELPRSSRRMVRFGTPISRSEIRPGDLVFFATGPDPSVVSHVAIYIGQDSIIHAISDGPERGVTVTPLSARYWRSRYHSARRVLPLRTAAETAPAAGSGSPASQGASPAGDEPQTRNTTKPIEYAKGTYTGELRNGEPHGTGVLRLNNGDRYEGEFREGLIQGQGTYTWADGRTYSGMFEDGAPVETATPETYLEEKDSPWNEWDGVVRGDFAEWWQQEQDAFEQWKQEQQDY
jgi:hypothetical protein